MKKRTYNRIIVVLIFILVLVPFIKIEAATLEERQRQLNQEISEQKNNLEEKKAESRTLASEISGIDQNLDVIRAGIAKTNREITSLDLSIKDLNDQITVKEGNLKDNQNNLKRIIRLLYEKGDITAPEILASSDSVTSFLSQEEYTRAIQDKINDYVKSIKILKQELNKQKSDKEQKKKEQLSLRERQEKERQGLNSVMVSKNELLSKTKGEEANYQNLLQESMDQKRAVEREIADLARRHTGPFIGGGPVKRGNVIGYQGNSGFSTGSHLHFGLYKDGVDIDPMIYLNSGFLGWPLSSYTITQGYWGTFSHRGIGWPGGIDFVQYYGAPVMSAQDGTIVKSVRSNSGFGNHIIIDHNNGFMTLYAHLK